MSLRSSLSDKKEKQGDFHKPPCTSNHYILTLKQLARTRARVLFLQCLPTKIFFAEDIITTITINT